MRTFAMLIESDDPADRDVHGPIGREDALRLVEAGHEIYELVRVGPEDLASDLGDEEEEGGR